MNNADAILEAFQTYYETAGLAGVTDPELIFTLKDKLDHGGWYETHEVERVIGVIVAAGRSQAKLSAALQPVAQRLVNRYAGARDAYRNAKDAEQD